MKFRVYINNTMDGPFGVAELWKLEGFSLKTSVCPDGDMAWQPAGQYPVITRYSQQVTSGDYDPGQASPETTAKTDRHNWREAVIGQNMPEIKSSPVPSPDVLKKPLPPASQPAAPAKNFVASFGEYRRGVLLLLLGFVAVGFYYPETENLNTLLSDVSMHDSAITVMGARFHQLGSPHAGKLWKHKTATTQVMNPLPTVKPVASHAVPAAEVIEIGSEDLGNGMVSKTIVVTEMRDGIRVQQTKTIEVPAHPRKSTHKKASKSGSAELPNAFSAKIT